MEVYVAFIGVVHIKRTASLKLITVFLKIN